MNKIKFLVCVVLTPLFFAQAFESFLGNWAGFYQYAGNSKKTCDASMYVFKNTEERYLSMWGIDQEEGENHGIAEFGVANDNIPYSCEWDSDPFKCTYWQFIGNHELRGFRYEATNKSSKLIGYFYLHRKI